MAKIKASFYEDRYEFACRQMSHSLFRRMMARLEISLDKVQWSEVEQPIYRALDNCRRCASKAACAAWLDGGDPASSYARFCPNSETIDVLRKMTA